MAFIFKIIYKYRRETTSICFTSHLVIYILEKENIEVVSAVRWMDSRYMQFCQLGYHNVLWIISIGLIFCIISTFVVCRNGLSSIFYSDPTWLFKRVHYNTNVALYYDWSLDTESIVHVVWCTLSVSKMQRLKKNMGHLLWKKWPKC